MTEPQLALGTVQFGLAYGVAGRNTPVPESEVRAILERAWSLGITRLDTAPAYGTIEERLARLAGDLPFSIVTKIPPAAKNEQSKTAGHVRKSIERSRERLGKRLAGLLFHEAGDLEGEEADRLWRVARDATDDGVGLGPSCYDDHSLARIAKRFPVTMAQLPGSAIDQRVGRHAEFARIEVSLRSVFLQGLLLMPADEAAARVPAAHSALERWRAFCEQRALEPLEAALGVAKGLAGVRYCLIGVDSLAQLEEVAEAWAAASPIAAPQLDSGDLDVIDPRRWPPIKK